MSFATFLAGETLSPGDPVALTSGGVVYKCCAVDPNTSTLLGVCLESGVQNGQIRVGTDNAGNLYSNLTIGSAYYVGLASGTLVSGYENFVAELGNTGYASASLNFVGRAITSSRISIERGLPLTVVNPTAASLLLESSTSPITPFFILQEDGSKILLESAS